MTLNVLIKIIEDRIIVLISVLIVILIRNLRSSEFE